MNWVDKIKEIVGNGKNKGTLIVPDFTSRGRVFPTLSFNQLNDIHIGDSDTGAAIDLIAGQVTRGGFETSMNEKYTTKTEDGRTAKELVDDQSEIFGLDQIVRENVSDVVGYGESLLWKGVGSGIQHLIRILPATIMSFDFDDFGLQLQNITTRAKKFNVNELVRYSYNRIGKQPLGFGILQALGTALIFNGESRAPIVEIKARIMQAMAKQIDDFSAPNQMWVLPDVSDEKLPTFHAMIQGLKKGQRLTYNKPGATVINAIPERMRGMDFYVETLWNSYYLALQTPIPQLFAGNQLTQASANAALAIAEVGKIDDLRRYSKRIVEQEIFAVWVKEEGLDPLKAKVRLNWRLLQRPDSNVLLPIVEKSREFGDITRTEMRAIYSDMGLPIDPKATAELEQEEAKQQKTQQTTPPKSQADEPPNPNQPVDSAEKKYQMRNEPGKFAGQ